MTNNLVNYSKQKHEKESIYIVTSVIKEEGNRSVKYS